MQPLDINRTLAAISQPRLGSYRAFFAPADDLELYGLYCWNEALSSCLTSLINNLEITMRNAFHRELSYRYGGAAGTTSSDWYNTIGLAGRSLSNVQKITHEYVRGRHVPRTPIPNPDDVVSKLTFGFWKHLLDIRHDGQGLVVNWGDILTDILPNHRDGSPAYWARQRRQDELFARMDLVGDLRNRIAHLEPLWKAGPLLQEGRPRRGFHPQVVQPAPTTPVQAIARLRLVHNRALELLYWISSHRADDYLKSSAYARFQHITTIDGVQSYQYRQAGRKMSLLGLRKLIRSRSMVNGTIELTHRGQIVAVILPWGA